MPAPETAPAVVHLYNELNRLPWSERQRIEQIEWRLRQLRRHRPTDLRTAVALLYAVVRAGKAADAIELADWVWGLRQQIEDEVVYTYIAVLIHIGMYGRAATLTESLLRDSTGTKSKDVKDLLNDYWHAAIGSGDPQMLRHLLTIAGETPSGRKIAAFLAALSEERFYEAFHDHQQIVQRTVFGMQCAYSSKLYHKEDDVELAVYIGVDAPRMQRRLLEAKIDDALDAFYASVGLPEGVHVPLVTTTILELSDFPFAPSVQ